MCSDVAMATYVLVHGAWGGAHVWRKVRPLLRAAGHEVYTPSLTGIGERVHLTGPHVDLSVHIDDVVNTVLYEDLDGFLLVGYSYGGAVVTGSLAHIGERVRELVYLDAFVPSDGESVLDLTGLPEPERRVGAPWAVEPLPRDYDDPADAEWDIPRRTPHPLGCFTERVRLPHPLETWGFGRTFIKATDDLRAESGPDAFWEAADRFRDNPAWRYEELATNHMVPQNDPQGLAAILLSLDT